MSAHIYIEGGESKEDQIRCREGFRKLLESLGYSSRLPRLTACGSRNTAFDDFKTSHAGAKPGDFIAMLIDSEDPVADREKTWAHLQARDGWTRPADASDEQVLLMITCMETWIVADRHTLQQHYGHKLQQSALPATNNLETRGRHDVHARLEHATRNCSNAYKKGKLSFIVLGELSPAVLEPLLPSFQRMKRILDARL